MWYATATVVPEFRVAKNYEEAKRAMYSYTHQYQLVNGESVLPSKKFGLYDKKRLF